MSDELQLMLQAGNPLVSIETTDEERAVSVVQAVARKLGWPLLDWSLTTGLRDQSRYAPAGAQVADTARAALETVNRERARETIYLFRDLGPHGRDAHVHRLVRDAIELFARTRSTMILVDALPLPDELKRLAVRYELGWPDAEELRKVVKRTFRKIRARPTGNVEGKLTRKEVDQLVQTLRGLSCAQAERVVATAIYDDLSLTPEDLPRIVEAKRTLLGSTGCLETIAADFSSGDIGGLGNLKRWLKQRRDGFSVRAREFGLESPRGVLMLGVPGSGKSLCAKVVAADWNMPLLRLDPGVLYQKFIGETESQLRRALAQAESMAPAILWVDEIEKAFASASAASADGGLSKRMFGTLLSWMQDHRHPIFIIATANDISALPPELMRKGRFDEVFFVDLPSESVRAEILAIHLRRRGRDPKEIDVQGLAQAARDFSGAELEQVVVTGLFAAFTRRQALSEKHLLAAIRQTRPLAQLSRERVEHLRAWAQDRCVLAD